MTMKRKEGTRNLDELFAQLKAFLEPKFHSSMIVRDKVDIVLRGPDGRFKARRVIHNTVTPLGDAHTADQMSDKGETAMGWMAVGTGTPSATALGVELDRNALTSKTQGTGADDNDVIYVGTWAAGDGTGALTEAGVFNLVTLGGTMFVSASFAVVNKLAPDNLVITWRGTFGAT